MGTFTDSAPSCSDNDLFLWLTALPLSALGAWWAATRVSERRWPPIVAALLWMLAPPLLSALTDGRPTGQGGGRGAGRRPSPRGGREPDAVRFHQWNQPRAVAVDRAGWGWRPWPRWRR